MQERFLLKQYDPMMGHNMDMKTITQTTQTIHPKEMILHSSLSNEVSRTDSDEHRGIMPLSRGIEIVMRSNLAKRDKLTLQ